MMEVFDSIELIGRSFRVPNEGLTFTKHSSRFVVYPIQTNRRIYNKSEIGDFYIFAAEFGTYIIPFVFDLEDILKDSGFTKVSSDILPVNINSEYMPVGTKNQSLWYHMTNVVNKYNANTAYKILKSKRKTLEVPSFLDVESKIPLTGVYDFKKGKMWYAMASIRFPHINEEKLGKFNFDNDQANLLVYAGDGDTYLLHPLSCVSTLVEQLEIAGYNMDKSLYVPSLYSPIK